MVNLAPDELAVKVFKSSRRTILPQLHSMSSMSSHSSPATVWITLRNRFMPNDHVETLELKEAGPIPGIFELVFCKSDIWLPLKSL